jgi:hypothetical protein
MTELEQGVLSLQSVVCSVLASVVLVIAVNAVNKFLLKHH